MSRRSLARLYRDEFTGYSLAKFQQDLLAGLTVAAVALPLALAFGVASGASAAAGLVTAILAGIIMGLLTVLPSLILMMTSFTRVLVVLSILRQAMGLQQSPPNQVLVGLSPGERVVSAGNFLIDSESRLEAALAAYGERSDAHAPAP